MLEDQRRHYRVQFPFKLYALLNLATNNDMKGTTTCSGAATWLPHGRAFRIDDTRPEFMEVDVPMFFKQTKIRSFFRQLNFWGYRRIKEGPDAGAWYNEFFLRDFPQELTRMARVKVKSNKSKQTMTTANNAVAKEVPRDPDFYIMPSLPRNNIVESVNDNSRDVAGPIGEVALEMPTSPTGSIYQSNYHPTPTPSEQRDLSVISRHDVSSPCSIALQTNRNMREIICQQQRLSRRSQFTFANDILTRDEVWSRLEAGAMVPLPFDAMSPTSQTPTRSTRHSAQEEEQTNKRRNFSAGIMPLPFAFDASSAKSPIGNEDKSSSVVPLPFGSVDLSDMVSTENDIKSVLVAGLEPLPYDTDPDIPSDEFAKCIDNMIQIM